MLILLFRCGQQVTIMSAGEHIILLMYVEIAMNLIHAYTWQSVFVQLEKVKIYRAEFVCGRTETV